MKNTGKEMRVRYTHMAKNLARFPEVISLQRGTILGIIPAVTERHYDNYEDFEARCNRNVESTYFFPTINYFRNRRELQDEEFDEGWRLEKRILKEEIKKRWEKIK